MKTFEILYQAAGAGTGKTVQYDVFKPDKTLDATQSGTANEIGTTGRYHKTFDADTPGWTIEISDSAGGKAVKHIDQGRWDAHGMAGGINGVILAVADVQTAVDAAAVIIASVDTKVDSLGLAVGGVQTDVTALGNALAAIDVKIDDISAPPMVG